jgi:TRAP-type C4-dicarboxylate transport system permease small subunit
MRRSLDSFYSLLMAAAGLALLTAFASVMLGIIDRQLAWGLRGLDAYAGYAIASALFLALPGTFKRGEHIRVTLVLAKAPPALRGFLEWWCLTAGVVLTSALAWFACRMVWVSQTTHDISQGSDATPLWLPQIGMALGCIGLAVAFLDAALSRWFDHEFFAATSDAAAHVE